MIEPMKPKDFNEMKKDYMEAKIKYLMLKHEIFFYLDYHKKRELRIASPQIKKCD